MKKMLVLLMLVRSKDAPIYPPVDGIPPEDTTTRSEAWTLGDGSVVVLVAGKAGGVFLSNVEVLP